MKSGTLFHFCEIKVLAFLGHFAFWSGIYCKGITLQENSTAGGVGLTNSKNTNQNYLPGSRVRLDIKEAELMVYGKPIKEQ